MIGTNLAYVAPSSLLFHCHSEVHTSSNLNTISSVKRLMGTSEKVHADGKDYTITKITDDDRFNLEEFEE